MAQVQPFQEEVYKVESMEEAKKCITKNVKWETPRDGQLQVEIIKALGETGTRWLKEITNQAWNTGTIPQYWGRAIVCPIY